MPVPSSDYNKNEHYASFATTSRLVACLTSESLVPVYFVPSAIQEHGNFIGLCLLLRPVKNEQEVPVQVTLDSILAVVPLRGLPIIDNSACAKWNGIVCPRIDLVDNLDMQSHIYSVNTVDVKVNPATEHAKQTLESVLSQKAAFNLVDGYDAVQMWDRFATDRQVNGKLKEQIGQELGSSILFQSKCGFRLTPGGAFFSLDETNAIISLEYTYDNPKSLPGLHSSTIAWEQSVVEGHATHPVSQFFFGFFGFFFRTFLN
jgi:hypothetical protein